MILEIIALVLLYDIKCALYEIHWHIHHPEWQAPIEEKEEE